MTLEQRAQETLERSLVGYRRNGLNYWLHVLAEDHYLEGLEDERNHGFLPDGTRVRRQPTYVSQCQGWDTTLELWEIEDSHPLTKDKLDIIQYFANQLFDFAAIYTEVWVTDRYGLSHRKIYDVRNDVDSQGTISDTQPHEWRFEDEWLSE